MILTRWRSTPPELIRRSDSDLSSQSEIEIEKTSFQLNSVEITIKELIMVEYFSNSPKWNRKWLILGQILLKNYYFRWNMTIFDMLNLSLINNLPSNLLIRGIISFWISVIFLNCWIRLLVIFFRSKPASLPKFSVRNISAGNIFFIALERLINLHQQLSAGY